MTSVRDPMDPYVERCYDEFKGGGVPTLNWSMSDYNVQHLSCPYVRKSQPVATSEDCEGHPSP